MFMYVFVCVCVAVDDPAGGSFPSLLGRPGEALIGSPCEAEV